MKTYLQPFKIYNCYLIINNENYGRIPAMLEWPDPDVSDLYATLQEDPPADCGIDKWATLYFSRYEGPTGDELFLVSPDKLPDQFDLTFLFNKSKEIKDPI